MTNWDDFTFSNNIRHHITIHVIAIMYPAENIMGYVAYIRQVFNKLLVYA
jgi:hypothetical protein